jgi:hypothetical protein
VVLEALVEWWLEFTVDVRVDVTPVAAVFEASAETHLW